MKQARNTEKVRSAGSLRTFRNLTSFQLHVLARHSEILHTRHYRKLVGLNMRECRIIGIVGSYGEAPFKYLCEDLNLCREQVSELIKRLIAQGLLAKVVDTTDKRTYKTTLTARGRTVHKQLHEAAVSLNSEWLSVLPARQRQIFYDCLDVLTKSARAMRKAQLLRSSRGLSGSLIARPGGTS